MTRCGCSSLLVRSCFISPSRPYRQSVVEPGGYCERASSGLLGSGRLGLTWGMDDMNQSCRPELEQWSSRSEATSRRVLLSACRDRGQEQGGECTSMSMAPGEWRTTLTAVHVDATVSLLLDEFVGELVGIEAVVNAKGLLTSGTTQEFLAPACSWCLLLYRTPSSASTARG